jgi:hypothetical protein
VTIEGPLERRQRMLEEGSSQTPVEAGQVRLSRTLDGDDAPNPGAFLPLRRLGARFGGVAWLCLTLCDDPDMQWAEGGSGRLREQDEGWLVDWTEPLGLASRAGRGKVRP